MMALWRWLIGVGCLFGHQTPRFERIDGRQCHTCGRCGASWPVLPSVAGIREDWRPELAVLKARATAEKQRVKAAKLAQRAGVPTIQRRRA